jgi:tetratricopeptide (TPR) repeat protein
VPISEQHMPLSKIRLLPMQEFRLLPMQTIIPGAAGCIMLCASVLPWLYDPLQGFYSAWKLPVDIDWQFHASILSYGLLCTCCAILNFFTAYVHFARWQQPKGNGYFAPGYVSLGIFCMAPFFLFLLQYLWADVYGIDVLAQHTTQVLLIEQHLGYSVSGQLISLSPFTFSTATFSDRFVLLVDQATLGVFVPLVAGYLLIRFRRFQPTSSLVIVKKRPKQIWFAFMALGFLLLVAVFGRSPAAMMCEYTAKSSMAAGDNVTALKWLDAALFLNPALDQVSYFHIDRGRAYYSLHPNIQSDDSRVYLSFVYRQAGDYLDSEQELLAVWHAHPTTSWVVAESSITFELLAEFQQQQGGLPPIQRAENDVASMTWLQLLSKVDPTNVYSQYALGRLQYYLHSYSECITRMTKVIQLSRNTDIQSSAYTYMGLSMAGRGDVVNARKLFFKALTLDPGYHNNTAREELSGLH